MTGRVQLLIYWMIYHISHLVLTPISIDFIAFTRPGQLSRKEVENPPIF